MKKILVVVNLLFLLVVPAGVVLADQNNTGCGLGSILFEGKDGLFSQIFAASTNNTFGNQTFGITSGTSNCQKPASFASNEKLNKYVADNMDNLATDMAKGNGEYLETLAVLMDVPQFERAGLYTKLQSNFSKIFTSEAVTSVEILNNIETVLASS